MVESALRGVVREALARTASSGLPGAHHFYITFRTRFAGLSIPDYLTRQYADEMTVVLEHQFWDLEVSEQCFSVTLSFQNKPERLTIPFDAITAFADPAVKFGLQFQPMPCENVDIPAPAPTPAAKAAEKVDKAADVVALDAFRKK
ncbi:MAG TPA: ClpXP protease specificity-enhancing factor SspB [Stellaceae bacterium]|nr:ClpXP protease specificity-enhancing factor SspB [Stellaceae bacterium]